MPFFNTTVKVMAGALSCVIRGRSPMQLVVQFTDHCNARCPQCGMRVSERFRRSILDINTITGIIDRFAVLNGAAISFTGGEPMLHFKQLSHLISHASRRGIPHIRTGTNGFLFRDHTGHGFTDRVRRIAETLAAGGIGTFWISIDSADPELHETMRGLPGVIRGIEKALPVFESFGIYPSANLGINRNTGGNRVKPLRDRKGGITRTELYEHFRDSFDAFYRFVTELGFTIVNSCYPMSVAADNGLNAVYAASSAEDIISFTPREKTAVYRALFDTIPRHRSRIRIFSPRSSLHAMVRQHNGETGAGYPCLGGVDYFFISAGDGRTYPCGYRGDEDLGDFRTINMKKIPCVPDCRGCDWECFRDPSVLLGPLLELRRSPFTLARRLISDRAFLKIWSEDLAYYRACDYFSGRTKPDFARLRRFTKGADSAGNAQIMPFPGRHGDGETVTP